MKKILYFVGGALTFYITQLVLRLPLLEYLNTNMTFNKWSIKVGILLVSILIAFSAGIFEETGRFVLFKILPKSMDSLDPGVYAGLGHGIFEAVWIYITYMSGHPFAFIWAGLLERLFTIFFHLAMSIFIYDGMRNGEGVKALLLAIFIHGAVDGLIPIFQSLGLSFILFIIIGIVGIVSLVYSILMIKSEGLEDV